MKLKELTRYVGKFNISRVIEILEDDDTVVDLTDVFIRRNNYKQFMEYLFENKEIYHSDPNINKALQKNKSIHLENKDAFILDYKIAELDFAKYIKEVLHPKKKVEGKKINIDCSAAFNITLLYSIIVPQVDIGIPNSLYKEFLDFTREKLYGSKTGLLDMLIIEQAVECNSEEFILYDENSFSTFPVTLTKDGFKHPVVDEFFTLEDALYDFYIFPADLFQVPIDLDTNEFFRAVFNKLLIKKKTKARTERDLTSLFNL